MALEKAIGSLSSPGSTGSQSVTGLGFQPKVVMFFNADDFGDNGTRSIFGVACSSTERWVTSVLSRDNQSISETTRGFKTDACIHGSASESDNLKADFTSMDSDGFTINWSQVPGSTHTIYYFALGGSDISNCTAKTFVQPTSTGAASVTGTGFQPKLLIFGNTMFTNTTTNSTSNNLSIGAAISSTKQFANSMNDTDNQGTTTCGSRQMDNRALLRCDATGAIQTDADVTSLDSDGFSYNMRTANGAVDAIWGYLAIAGDFQVDVGTFLEPGATGTDAVTGVGFQPEAVLFASAMCNDDATTDHARKQLGVALSPTNRFSTAFNSTDNVGTSEVSSSVSTTLCVEHISGDLTQDSAADLDSFDSDGFTLDWTASDSSTHAIGYVAFASAGGGGANIPAIMHHRRMMMSCNT